MKYAGPEFMSMRSQVHCRLLQLKNAWKVCEGDLVHLEALVDLALLTAMDIDRLRRAMAEVS